MSRTNRSSQGGQAIALFTLALTAIVLGVAVVVDGGYAYAQRRVAQNAADFAAMAGTRIVGVSLIGRPAGAGTAANVESAITSTLAANDSQLVRARYVDSAGNDLGDVVGANSIPWGAFGVVVNAKTDWKPFLLSAIGIDSWEAEAAATAMTDGESDGGAVLPVAISEETYNGLTSCNPLVDYALCSQQPLTPGHLIGPGNFGWLSFGLQGSGGKCDWEYSLGMMAGGCEVNQPFLQSQIWPFPQDHGCCDPVGGYSDEGIPSVDRIGALTGNEWGDLSHYIDQRLPVWVPIYDSDTVQPAGNGSKAYYDIVGFGLIVFMGEGTVHAKWLAGASVDAPCAMLPDNKYCAGPGTSYLFDVTGEVQLRR